MATNLMTAMQPHGRVPYHGPDVDHHHMAAHMSNLCGDPDGWTSSSGFAASELSVMRDQFTLNTDFQPDQSLGRHNKRPHDTGQHDYATCVSRPQMNLAINTSQQYPSPSMFTPTNAMESPQQVTTISPMQTCFDPDDSSASSSTNYSFGHRLPTSPPYALPFPTMPQPSSSKQRRDSQQASDEKSSPTVSHASPNARKRRSEYAEPGSARAVYLEKNRKAASKCRSKQKMQQEELVETARDVERRNKALKAEVEFLRSGMRDLMDIVGQHTACPDSRLRTYVQREADRLASDGTRKTQFSLPNTTSSSGHGSATGQD